jgi:hypothetical protein
VESGCYFRLEEGKGKVAFEQTMKHLLHAISGMMLHTSDNTLLAQVMIVCSYVTYTVKLFKWNLRLTSSV